MITAATPRDAEVPGREDAGFEVLVRHYEDCLLRHGATPQGVDWPNGADLEARFSVMLDLLDGAGARPTLLDLGCGPGFLVDYLDATGRLDRVRYRGIDLSPRMIKAARQRWPTVDFECRNMLSAPLQEQSVDIVVMNGVLTERQSLSQDRMRALAASLVKAAFDAARIGISFNVMSTHVDWQRPDLFHWAFDDVAAFLRKSVSRHYSFRADYGLHEYTVTVRREPSRPQPALVEWGS